MMNNKTILCLMGPTASGKTALACQLVEHLNVEIISVDSAMIYREMDIGTAKPDAELLARAPHHLINIRNPSESYSAADFCDDVNKLCKEIFLRGNQPLLVGGTMMYFNALQQGLSCLPPANMQVREELLLEAQLHGWDALHKRLALVDETAASRIHPHDQQRIQRALEVYQLTQQSLTSLLAEKSPASTYNYVNIALLPKSRAWLHNLIAQRFKSMLNDGLIDEVAYIVKKWSLTYDHPALRCVGYRQVFEYLQASYNLETLYEKGVAATRQLAKRQLTWLRSWPNTHIFEAENPPTITQLVELMK